MASINVHISRDGVKSFRVRIQRKGQKTLSATFPTLSEARKYATMIEGRIIEGRHFPTTKTHRTLSELLERYDREIMPKKDEETQKTHRAALHFWRDRLGHKTLEDITREDIIQGRDELSKTRKPATVHKYMSIITHSLNIAVKEYGWLHQNVASTVSRPPLPPIKVRFLSDDERNRLLEECKKSKNPYVYALVSLAIYLGLRRGSLLTIKKSDIDLNNKMITIMKTKNKTTLVLPLVDKAYDLICDLYDQNTTNKYLFPSQRWGSYRTAFEEAVRRANIPDFSYHKLRSSTASYLIQQGIPLYTVGAVLGHKNPATVTYRYAHLATDNIKDALETLARRLEK